VDTKDLVRVPTAFQETQSTTLLTLEQTQLSFLLCYRRITSAVFLVAQRSAFLSPFFLFVLLRDCDNPHPIQVSLLGFTLVLQVSWSLENRLRFLIPAFLAPDIVCLLIDHLKTQEAVRREVKEETGIEIGNVKYESSQPWPFPSQLMIGCRSEALSQEISVDRSELEDAKWFTREEVAKALPLGTEAPNLKLPPKFAIAHQLMKSWIEDTNTQSKI